MKRIINLLWAIATTAYSCLAVYLLWEWIAVPLGQTSWPDSALLTAFFLYLPFRAGWLQQDDQPVSLRLPISHSVMDTVFIGIGWLIHMALV